MIADEIRREAFAKFKKRFDEASPPCSVCPGSELEGLYTRHEWDNKEFDTCVELCGHVWPSLRIRVKIVNCPCHTWGHEKASKALERYLNEQS
jgi:hypothetical protein